MECVGGGGTPCPTPWCVCVCVSSFFFVGLHHAPILLGVHAFPVGIVERPKEVLFNVLHRLLFRSSQFDKHTFKVLPTKREKEKEKERNSLDKAEPVPAH